MSSLYEIQNIFDEILNNNNLKNYDDAITKYNIGPLLGLDKQMKITLIDDSEYYINEDEIFNRDDFYYFVLDEFTQRYKYTPKIKEIVFQKDTILNMSLRSVLNTSLRSIINMTLRFRDDYIPSLFGRLEKISYLNNDTGEKVKVKLVGNCSCLFKDNEEFDENINDWDVSQVTEMEDMFGKCRKFNQPLNNWDVSRVTNMKKMFYKCYEFNQNINTDIVFDEISNIRFKAWDVSRVEDMNDMFYYCVNFNQPLNDWDVSQVTNMRYMFWDCRNFNQPLNNWDVSQVTNMKLMFYNCRNFNQPLNNWDVSKVTDMSEMFLYCRNFNKPLLENIAINESKKEEIINSLPENMPMALIETIILKYASYKAWDVSNVEEFLYIFVGCGIREENKPLRFR